VHPKRRLASRGQIRSQNSAPSIDPRPACFFAPLRECSRPPRVPSAGMRGGHGTGEGSADAALRMRGFSRAGGDVESGISVDEFDDGNSPSSPIEAAKRANATSTARDASSANHTTAKLWGIPLKMQGKDLALFLGTGALVSYLGFTSTQESVFHNAGPGGFQHGGAVTLVTTLVYGILAYLERVRAGEHTVRKGSWRHYFVLALLTSSGMYATNAALTYLNYTTRYYTSHKILLAFSCSFVTSVSSFSTHHVRNSSSSRYDERTQ